MGTFQEDRVEDMTILFEEQLSIVYPMGPSCFHLAVNGGNDVEEDSIESKELFLLRNCLKNMVDELPYPSELDGVKKSFAIAVHRWKAKCSQTDSIATSEESDKMMAQAMRLTTGSTKPMSLLDQLQGGFPLPISFEEIRDAPSSEERLNVLQKVNYLEDLLMDWNKIHPLLTDDLCESFLFNPDLAVQLINLHRKWFDQGRSSSEYTPLLYGICEKLLETLTKIISDKELQEMQDAIETSQCTIVASLVQNWSDMWLDLMQRDQYMEELAEPIEKYMFELFLRPGSYKMSRMAQKILGLSDPSAKWFQSWVNHVQTSNLISFFRSSNVLRELWTRSRTFQDNSGRHTDSAPFQLHSIAVLSITLCQTRLSQFPWDAFTNSKSPEDLEIMTTRNNCRPAIDEILELFLRAINFVSLNENRVDDLDNTALKITILDGIEAILSGSHNLNESEVDRRYTMVKSSLQDQAKASDRIVDHFLKVRLE